LKKYSDITLLFSPTATLKDKPDDSIAKIFT